MNPKVRYRACYHGGCSARPGLPGGLSVYLSIIHLGHGRGECLPTGSHGPLVRGAPWPKDSDSSWFVFVLERLSRLPAGSLRPAAAEKREIPCVTVGSLPSWESLQNSGGQTLVVGGLDIHQERL